MLIRQISLLLIVFLLIGQTVSARCHPSISCCPNAIGQGKFTTVSYAAYAQSRRKAATETQAINQYMTSGYQFEAKKNYAAAEQSYRHALKEIALRDGPGSDASIPSLEHLAIVTKAQNNLDDAIEFQDRAVQLRKAQTSPNYEAILQAQLNLSGLLLQKHDYRDAELALKDAVAIYNAQPSLMPAKRTLTFQRYAEVCAITHPDAIIDGAAKTTAVSADKPTTSAMNPDGSTKI
jgi:tetratricopeptide (TPR) repeat protein